MHCPYCRNTDSKVLDSRVTEDGGSIRRRRQCPACEIPIERVDCRCVLGERRVLVASQDSA